MTRVAIIADDLTGALDTAAPFACRDLSVGAGLDPAAIDAALASAPDVLAVTTNSRALSGESAAALAGVAAERLLSWRPDLVLKKVDSRLKGNIAEETAAVAEAFGFARILAAPAVPDQGRLVENGHVVGRGIDGRLSIADWMPRRFAISVRDAGSDDDLDRIAAEWRGGDSSLYVCARGLAAAFARRLAAGARPKPFFAKPPVIVAVGSRDPITERQVSALVAARNDATVVEAPAGRLPTGRAGRTLTIFVCTGEMSEAPALVAKTFARSVAAEISRLRPSTVLLTGGDTALAVLQALGVKSFRIQGEAAPGLPRFETSRGDGQPVVVVTKSGGFGSEDILSRLFGPGAAVDSRMAELSGAAQYRE